MVLFIGIRPSTNAEWQPAMLLPPPPRVGVTKVGLVVPAKLPVPFSVAQLIPAVVDHFSATAHVDPNAAKVGILIVNQWPGAVSAVLIDKRSKVRDQRSR